jgi:hypothetical protein
MYLYVELPPFHMLSSLLICNDHNEFRNFATQHPLVQLRHDLLDVGLHLVVGGNCVDLVKMVAAEVGKVVY